MSATGSSGKSKKARKRGGDFDTGGSAAENSRDPSAKRKKRDTVRSMAAAKHVEGTIAAPGPQRLRVMSWNIEGFGGGFRERQRDADIIEATASIIRAVNPDICTILEVMLRSRPRLPKKPIRMKLRVHDDGSARGRWITESDTVYAARYALWEQKCAEILAADQAVPEGYCGLDECERLLDTLNGAEEPVWEIWPPLDEPEDLGGETVRFVYKSTSITPMSQIPIGSITGYRAGLVSRFDFRGSHIVGLCGFHAPAPAHQLDDFAVTRANEAVCENALATDPERDVMLFCADTNLDTLNITDYYDTIGGLDRFDDPGGVEAKMRNLLLAGGTTLKRNGDANPNVATLLVEPNWETIGAEIEALELIAQQMAGLEPIPEFDPGQWWVDCMTGSLAEDDDLDEEIAWDDATVEVLHKTKLRLMKEKFPDLARGRSDREILELEDTMRTPELSDYCANAYDKILVLDHQPEIVDSRHAQVVDMMSIIGWLNENAIGAAPELQGSVEPLYVSPDGYGEYEGGDLIERLAEGKRISDHLPIYCDFWLNS